MQHKQNKRGFTLTELAIVLGVIGAIVGAIWYAASNVHEAERENNALTEARTIAHNINSLFAGQKLQMGATDTITPAMITAQTIPGSYVDSVYPTTAVDSPWDSGVPDAGSHSNRGLMIYWRSATTYRLSFYNVPRQACLALLTAMTNCQSGQSDCPIQAYTDWAGVANSLYTGGTALPANTSWTGIATTSAINTLCNANNYPGSPTSANSVEFDFAP